MTWVTWTSLGRTNCSHPGVTIHPPAPARINVTVKSSLRNSTSRRLDDSELATMHGEGREKMNLAERSRYRDEWQMHTHVWSQSPLWNAVSKRKLNIENVVQLIGLFKRFNGIKTQYVNILRQHHMKSATTWIPSFPGIHRIVTSKWTWLQQKLLVFYSSPLSYSFTRPCQEDYCLWTSQRPRRYRHVICSQKARAEIFVKLIETSVAKSWRPRPGMKCDRGALI